jgi:dihydroorotate dehydrogenase (fumarate)
MKGVAMELTTTYLGLKLRNPLIVGACPLSGQLETARQMESNGAAALVMPSLYEERMRNKPEELPYYEQLFAGTAAATNASQRTHSPFEPMHYLDRITRLKREVSIPVIASVSCTSTGDWTQYAGLIEKAGADALELNIFMMPTDPTLSAADVENRVIEMVAEVRQRAKLPLAIKLSPFYTSLPHLAAALTQAGANGLVLFTRSYQPDIDIERRLVATEMHLSHVADESELRLRMRWLAILAPQTKLSLALTGGLHTGLDAVKAVMCGARAVQVVSALMNAGPTYLASLLDQFKAQMVRAGFNSVAEMCGSLNARSGPGGEKQERRQFMTTLHSWPTSLP